MQHSQNRREFDINPRVMKMVRGYMNRMYYDMATTLFRKTKAEAKADGFILQEADFDTWDWDTWFVDTERIETVVHSRYVFTEDQKKSLAQGIPAATLPHLEPFPGTANPDAADLSDSDAEETATDSGSTGSIVNPW
jgi:hypothetical protein